jgi:hypothetical protein
MWRARRLKEIADSNQPAFNSNDGAYWWLAGGNTVAAAPVSEAPASPLADLPAVQPVVTSQPDAPTSFNACSEMSSPQNNSNLDVLTALIESVAADPAPAVVEDRPAPIPSLRREKELAWDSKIGCFV